MDTPLTVKKVPLHVPTLESLSKVLGDGLCKNFSDVSVSVVDCPDLTKEPYRIAEKGICGSARIADIGGVPNLMPLVQRDKKYDFEKISELCELPDALIIGAGAGPAHVVGVNSELMPNMKMGKDGENCSHICKMNPETGDYEYSSLDDTRFMLLMNVLLSEGKSGQVLEVKARHRTGAANYMSCIQQTLAVHYGDKPVALGGLFVIETGKAKLHVMPDFSPVPLKSDEEIDEWLRFFEMKSPLTCTGYMVSHDPGYDLRMEHFHCFSSHGDGGHYHYDTTPNEVSYTGYFTIPEYLYRIDQPTETHDYGRD